MNDKIKQNYGRDSSLVQQNYYLVDYYNEVSKDIGLITEIDFGKRMRTLGEIKKEHLVL